MNLPAQNSTPRFRAWVVAWGPAATWAVFLFLLSELQGVPRVVSFANNDKLIHFGLYAILGGLLAWGRIRHPSALNHGIPLLGGFLYGAVDELHQRFVPYRNPSWLDWIADISGVIVGYVLAGLLLTFLLRRLTGTTHRE